jgi:hypothetical protein
MTDTILTFPIISRSPLSCIWIETGNPNQPLTCVWIVLRPRKRGRSSRKDGAPANRGERESA